MPESTLSNFINLLIYSLATVMGLVVVIAIVALFIRDITQKQHTLLRNYPVIGRLRYFFEIQGNTSGNTCFQVIEMKCPLIVLLEHGFIRAQK